MLSYLQLCAGFDAEYPILDRVALKAAISNGNIETASLATVFNRFFDKVTEIFFRLGTM